MKSEKRVLLLLAASAAMIILVTVLTLFSGKESAAGTARASLTPGPTAAVPTQKVTGEHNILAMIKAVDTAAGTITLYHLEEGGEITLTYGTAADIRSKYGNLAYAASLTFGDIVRAEYDTQGHLVRMQESSGHWELHGVEEFSIAGDILTVNDSNYRITDYTVFYCEGEEIEKGEVKSIDRINLCGTGSEILSICITKGHGSIKLINCSEFQGAEVTFGNEKHVLDGEPSYLIREGKHTVTVTGKDRKAAAEITVARNEQIVIDLYEYGGAPVQTAEVRFRISPFSARLRIDGNLTEYYEQDLTLAYGEHQIEAELGGYVTYKGILAVSRPYQTIKIDLTERRTPENGGTEPGDDKTGTGNEETGDGDGKTGTGDDKTGTEPGDGETGTGTANRRYVAIGEAAGYTYDKEHSTFILVPEGAVVLIDGISLGAAPVEFEKILGTYTITLRKEGKEKQYTVTVENDDEDVYWKFPME